MSETFDTKGKDFCYISFIYKYIFPNENHETEIVLK